jgi:hypothetical protein
MRSVLPALLALSLAACRPDPGIPDYSSMAALLDSGVAGTTKKPGTVPYVPGVPRLSFAIFYEGEASDVLPLDNYYIFNNTYSTTPSDDCIEGLKSDELDFSSPAFWGGGVFWNTPTSLAGWTKLHVSLKSTEGAPGLASLKLKLLYGTTSAPTEVAVKATAYGYVNDGAWHDLVIPLADFTSKGLDLTKVVSPFTFGDDGAPMPRSGEALFIDDVYVF